MESEIHKGSDGQNRVEVRYEEDTVWLKRNQMASLFGRDVKNCRKTRQQRF